MTTQRKPTARVLVVGAGPVGLFTALCAARHGVEVELIDQNWRGRSPGHATLLHPHSLDLLNELGLGERLLRVGKPLDRLDIIVGPDRVASLALPTPALAVSQQTLEDVLLHAVRASGIELLAPYQATSISQARDTVKVGVIRRERVREDAGAEYDDWEPVESFTWNFDYVIGADGYDSGVRSALGVEAVDVNGSESFAIFEFPSTVEQGPSIEISFGDGLSQSLLPLPNGRARAAFQVLTGLSDVQDLAHLRRLAEARMPWFRGIGDTLDWGLMTHFERRLVRRFGAGQVWLAGDAAHVTSPFGGHSMNAGLREGYEYVARIATARSNAEGRAALDEFGSRQVREWYRLLGVNVSFDLLPHAPAWLAAHARKLVPALPATGPELDGHLRELGLAIH